MRLALITDLHTGMAEEHPFDIDLRQNFLDILGAVRQSGAEHLLILGDLCLKDGNAEVYRWQKTYLDELGMPYSIIPGNHDDAQVLAYVFPQVASQSTGELYFDHRFGGHNCLMLDTSRGYTSSQQKAWLKQRIKAANDYLLICMHHPPTLINVPHMDLKHYLHDKDETMEILRSSEVPIYIFCGHYHVEKVIHLAHLHIHVTPSCYFQLDGYIEDFKVDHKRIAYRIIELADMGIETSVHYLDGNLVPAAALG